MKRLVLLLFVVVLAAAGLTACKRQPAVTVSHGEIVLCTEGEIVSDTTEEIQVPADEVANYSVTTRIETCDLHAKLSALYAQAQAAILSGDLSTAEEKLSELVSLDPSYKNAGGQLDRIQGGQTPDSASGTAGGGDGSDSPGDSNQRDEQPTGPVMNLARYVPDVLSGYVAQAIYADVFVLTRDYLPAQSGPVTHLVIVAEQFKDAEHAREELDTNIKPAYSQAAYSFNLGSKEAYFGANRRAGVALVAFIDNGILVAVEGAAASGDGTSIESRIKAVAEEIGK